MPPEWWDVAYQNANTQACGKIPERLFVLFLRCSIRPLPLTHDVSQIVQLARRDWFVEPYDQSIRSAQAGHPPVGWEHRGGVEASGSDMPSYRFEILAGRVPLAAPQRHDQVIDPRTHAVTASSWCCLISASVG
jgi:hypothetical protein